MKTPKSNDTIHIVCADNDCSLWESVTCEAHSLSAVLDCLGVFCMSGKQPRGNPSTYLSIEG